MDRLTKVIIIGVAVLLFGGRAEAATLSFDVANTNTAVGNQVAVQVWLNTEGASINAVDLGIIYPAIFGVSTISKTGSFIQIWVKEPSYTDSAIFLSGGVPGGINSSHALVGTIIFQARSVGEGALGLSPTSSILLNDGSGTSAPISLETPTFHIIPQKSNQPAGSPEPQKESQADFTAPKGFSLEVASDPRVFNGKYFVSFFTSDSGSGVDHYAIQEGSGPYKIAQSPYLLSDQNLHTVIHVRAYDGAGNYREETYPGFFKRFWWWITSIGKHIWP